MKRFFSWLRNTLLAGLAVLVPLGITIWLVVSLVSFVDGVLDVLPEVIHPEAIASRYLGREITLPGLGILIASGVVFGVGLFMRMYIGQKVYDLVERLVLRIPLLSGIYQGLKKLFDTLFGNEGMRFRQVVLVEYPRRGAWAIAFLTGNAPWLQGGADFQDDTPVSIFLPTTPNPTSGFYLMVPACDIRLLDMGVEEAFKLIMSAGIVHPEDLMVPRSLSPEDVEPAQSVDPPAEG